MTSNIIFEQNRSLGSVVQDLLVNHVSSTTIQTKTIMALDAIDKNLVEIEQDIADLNDILQQQTSDLNIVEEVVLQLNTIQGWPWWYKKKLNYHTVTANLWSPSATIPDGSTDLFERSINLPQLYTGLIMILPISVSGLTLRHASLYLGDTHMAVFVSTNAQTTTRLSATTNEWVNVSTLGDVNLGFSTLLQRPENTYQYVFGSDIESNLSGAKCIVFPTAGSMFIQSLYIDITDPTQHKLVLIGQKFNTTSSATLGDFEYYGLL